MLHPEIPFGPPQYIYRGAPNICMYMQGVCIYIYGMCGYI